MDQLWSAVTLDAPYNTLLVLRSVAVLGAACGAIGVFLLLRRRSLVADAIAHAALPGVALGFLISVALGREARSMSILLPSAAGAGVLGVACIHALTRLRRVREDAAIGVVLSVFFAIGIVLLGVIQAMPVSHKAGLNQFIFGQAATMSAADGRAILIVSSLALLTAALCFKELRLLCFDPAFAQGIGFSRLALDGLLMSLVTLLTVIGLHAVGALLMVALLIIPAAAARFWSDRLGTMAAIAAGVGAVGAFVGAAGSAMEAHTPTGPAIVLACGALFVLSMTLAPRRGIVASAARRWSLERRIARQHLLRAMYERGEISGDVSPGASTPVLMADLQERRSWSDVRVRQLLRRAARRGEVAVAGEGHVLTPKGQAAAARLVRTHRLWEHYLATQADIAPGEIDRAADEIEHALGEEVVRELEAELQARRVRIDGDMPASAHELTGEEAAR